MATGVGIADIGNTSVASPQDLFIIGVRSETVDNNGQTIVSYDTQAITFADLKDQTLFIDLTDLSVAEVDGTVYNDAGGIEYDNTTGVFTLTKPYLRSNTEITDLFSAEDGKITVSNGVIGLGSVSTTDISEGNKLFYTTSRATSAARAAISVSGSLAYNSSTGVVSYTERTDDEIRGLFSAGTGIIYDDNTGEISLPQSIAPTSSVTFGDITAPSLYTAPGNESTGGIYIYDNAIKFANRSGGTGDNWVGVINQWNSTSYQRLDIGAGDGLTGSGVTPQGAYTSYYGPQDVFFPSQIRNVVRDGSTQKTAGGWHANGQFFADHSADITGDLVVSGTIFGDLQGQATTAATIGNFSTTDLAEGSNRYFTDQRVIDALPTGSTSDLPEGSRLYYTDARVTTRIESTSINTLSDVNTTTQLVDGAILSWNASNAKWESVASKDNLPIGTIQWFSGLPQNVPAGWLEADGSQVTSTYPTLRQFLIDNGSPYGTSNDNPLLPDLRGRFARGYNPSGVNNGAYTTGLGEVQDDSMGNHRHGAGTLATNEAGLHSHTVKGNNGGSHSGQKSAPWLRVDDAETLAQDPDSIQPNGAHTHTITGYTSYDGGSLETRPRNLTLIPIIKAWGTLLNTSNLGVADIAGLLNNIATQSQAVDGSDNTSFMSPLRTRQAIDDRVDSGIKVWTKTQVNPTSLVENTHWYVGSGSGSNNISQTLTVNESLQMRSVKSKGWSCPANVECWFDLGKILYNLPDTTAMSYDYMPTNWNVTFSMTSNKHGVLAGSELIIDNAWYGNGYGTGQWFQLEEINGVSRLLFRVKTSTYMSLQQSGAANSSYIRPTDGLFNFYFTKNGIV